MNQKKSIWQQADSFLSLSRKVIINGVTVLFLIVITFSVLGGLASSFSGSDEIETKDKILWFKPMGVVVDSKIGVSNSINFNALMEVYLVILKPNYFKSQRFSSSFLLT